MKAELGVGLAVATATAAVGWYLRRAKEEAIPSKWIALGNIEELLIYPLKSGAPQVHEEVSCSPWGPFVGDNRDRMLAVVRADDGSLVTGRDFSKLILVSAVVEDKWTITLSADGFAALTVNLEQLLSADRQSLKIWKAVADGVDCGDEVADWLSRYLDSKVRLLFYPVKDSGKRIAKLYGDLPFVKAGDGAIISPEDAPYHLINLKSVKDLNTRLEHSVNPRCFRPNMIVSGELLTPYEEDNWQWIKIGDTIFKNGKFSDATSFHLVSNKSVGDLNTRLEEEVAARNFRPNIIISGDKLLPYEEDSWQWVKIGDTTFRVLGPCTRCLFTTVNPWTSEKSDQHEPLKTLLKYRGLRDPQKKKLFGLAPVMGTYLGLRGGSGIIKVGDTISVAV